jgi:tetratricopeptide (TPR) repeat protein
MNVTVGKFRAGILNNEQVIETYSYLMERVEAGLEKSPADRLYNARDIIEQLFADSGAADCDALIKLFAVQVTESPDDVDLLNKVNDLLTGADCTDSELYLRVTEKIHVLDPSPRSALNLSAMYRELNNDDQVVRYLKEAVDLQEDEVERANYYLELAIIANQVKQDRQLSRQYALQALNDNPSLGRAHLHIGSLYASESNCFTDDDDADFKKRTVYWAAVDRFNQAKRVDPSVSSEADQMIETYSFYFPDNETIFFHGYTEGETYTVGCWINETTRIRARAQ